VLALYGRLALRGILLSLAGEEWPGRCDLTYDGRTVPPTCLAVPYRLPWQQLPSCELMAFPAAVKICKCTQPSVMTADTNSNRGRLYTLHSSLGAVHRGANLLLHKQLMSPSVLLDNKRHTILGRFSTQRSPNFNYRKRMKLFTTQEGKYM